MATFKDKYTGTTVQFTDKWDVDQMRIHPDYIEVEEQKEDQKETKTLTLPKKDK